MKINKIVKIVHENAQAKGWWDEERSFAELIALCHSELSEALEDYRVGHAPTHLYFEGEEGKDIPKPCGIPTELADVVIRIMDMCGHYGIDLEAAIKQKIEFNKTRKSKHGGKRI